MLSSDASRNHRLRAIPSVQALLTCPELAEIRARRGTVALTRAIRNQLAECRQAIANGGDLDVSIFILAEQIKNQFMQPRLKLREVINATGILLHTGLGRSPLGKSAIDAIVESAYGYSNLEFDLETGERGHRTVHVERLLTELTGAGAATVVNNNAAATVLALRGLAGDGEVIVSRGELIEIGGSYRLPDIFEVSGAKLKEVGTTNKTRLSDYEKAIGPNTRAILRVHSSNFKIVGFTESAPLPDLARLARERGITLIDDLGSGAIRPGLLPATIDDPTVTEGIEAGADVVLFSGDKLLGGPQCGIVVGKKHVIKTLEADPMMRAFRVDKLTLSALEATLRTILDGEGSDGIPLWRMLKTPVTKLQARAESIALNLRPRIVGNVEALPSTSYIGGGSVPADPIASYAVRVSPPFLESISANEMVRKLRMGFPSVVARIHANAIWFDLRAVPPERDNDLASAITSIFNNSANS